MKNYNPEYESDKKEVEHLNPPDWMLNALKLNPCYCGWGPGEDYMPIDTSNKLGWSAHVVSDNWETFGPWQLDELNIVANFYFEIQRETEVCQACKNTGLNPETKRIEDDWYDFDGTGRKWCHNITQHEVDALVDNNRLWELTKQYIKGEGWVDRNPPVKVTADEVNAWSISNHLGHDAINKFICVRARAEKLGVYGHCPECAGHGYIFTEPECRLALVLWVLHPRKGASRPVTIKNITQETLPKAIEFLKEAARQNSELFRNL